MNLQYAIEELNSEYNLEIDLSYVEELYGDSMVESMEHMSEEVLANIRYLIERKLGDVVSDVCNRYGPVLLEDPGIFSQRVDSLIQSLGDDPAEAMGEDLSVWEALM